MQCTGTPTMAGHLSLRQLQQSLPTDRVLELVIAWDVSLHFTALTRLQYRFLSGRKEPTWMISSKGFKLNPSTCFTGARIFHRSLNCTGIKKNSAAHGIVGMQLGRISCSWFFMYQNCILCQGKIEDEKYGSASTKVTWNDTYFKIFHARGRTFNVEYPFVRF